MARAQGFQRSDQRRYAVGDPVLIDDLDVVREGTVTRVTATGQVAVRLREAEDADNEWRFNAAGKARRPHPHVPGMTRLVALRPAPKPDPK